MANLIDTTYFINEITVAQADFQPIATSLDAFISKYEPIYLSRVLGLQLYNEFVSGLAAPVPLQKWIDLRDGAEFTDSCGNLRKWTGFLNAEKVSPIAYYIYKHWLYSSSQQTTGSGEAAIQTENALRVNIHTKVITIWNQMVEMNITLGDFIIANTDDYGAWKPYYDNLYGYHDDFCHNELFHYLNYLDL